MCKTTATQVIRAVPATDPQPQQLHSTSRQQLLGSYGYSCALYVAVELAAAQRNTTQPTAHVRRRCSSSPGSWCEPARCWRRCTQHREYGSCGWRLQQTHIHTYTQRGKAGQGSNSEHTVRRPKHLAACMYSTHDAANHTQQQSKARKTRTLGAPAKVATVEAQCTALGVATTGAHVTDATLLAGTSARHQLGHGRLATSLKLALLLVNIAAATGVTALVPRVASDS